MPRRTPWLRQLTSLLRGHGAAQPLQSALSAENKQRITLVAAHGRAAKAVAHVIAVKIVNR